MRFYNTINETGQTLLDLQDKSETCESRVLDFFKTNSSNDFTPAEVWQFLSVYGYPLTSIRARMNTLTLSGDLEKLDKKRMGNFNVQNYTWKLK